VNGASFFESVIAASSGERTLHRDALDAFLNAGSLKESLVQLKRLITIPENCDKRRLINIIQFYIAEIDSRLNAQLNVILHDECFQRLEASWCGVYFLTGHLNGSESVKIKLLDVSWRELSKDFGRAIEFDQSQLFRKVYNAEYDIAGGEPYGVLLGDYYVPHRPTKDMPYDNIGVLRSIATVASAAFAPFITSTHPAFFGVSQFSELSRHINLDALFKSKEYMKWARMREDIDTRFVGMTVPRVLMRRPYTDDVFRADGFPFAETIDGERDNYLWGNACYAFGSILIRAFRKHGWFADIRGTYQGELDGGVVNDLVVADFATDSHGAVLKYTTDVLITDEQEKELSELGLIPLSHNPHSEYAIFYSNQSLHGHKHYDDELSRANARLGSMLQYILCVSRFAHYLKVMGREKVGSFLSADECQHYFKKWLMQFAISSDTPSYEMRARHPLNDCNIEIREVPGRPGIYGCVVQLKPHAQIDQLMSSIKLVTELVAAKIT